MSKQYLRKAAVAARYGITPRSVELKVRAGTLPPPEYPAGNRIPLWDEDILEANERRAVAGRHCVTTDAATAAA